MMSNIYLETLNIEWGQIDPKDNRRVKWFHLRDMIASYLAAVQSPQNYNRKR